MDWPGKGSYSKALINDDNSRRHAYNDSNKGAINLRSVEESELFPRKKGGFQ